MLANLRVSSAITLLFSSLTADKFLRTDLRVERLEYNKFLRDAFRNALERGVMRVFLDFVFPVTGAWAFLYAASHLERLMVARRRASPVIA